MNTLVKSMGILIVVFSLSGCKLTAETEVSLKDILESQTKNIDGDLYVQVPSCNSYKDSRKPSDSVIKVQQTIPNVFKDAHYIECFSKNFDSLAHFSIPVVLDKDVDGKFASEYHINLISNNKELLMVGIPPSIKANMEKAKRESLRSFDLQVNIKIHNDIGKEFPFRVMAAYVEGKPFVFGNMSAKANSAFVITLSDVSVSRALEIGIARVLKR